MGFGVRFGRATSLWPGPCYLIRYGEVYKKSRDECLASKKWLDGRRC
jgi:hypothetical protein